MEAGSRATSTCDAAQSVGNARSCCCCCSRCCCVIIGAASVIIPVHGTPAANEVEVSCCGPSTAPAYEVEVTACAPCVVRTANRAATPAHGNSFNSACWGSHAIMRARPAPSRDWIK